MSYLDDLPTISDREDNGLWDVYKSSCLSNKRKNSLVCLFHCIAF